ncbi:poly [ADP-ribose] polymerase 1-like isoform X3 [Dysidea avara]|uniref:poly [ADP-ribose] polymerase 1-like isoform X3 n=1 Tax=Dysidea avara TaxID=196820 RepID=UPI00331D4653
MATPNFNFLAEYAKSSRSSCKNCGNTIDKGELRLAEMVQAPNFDGKIPKWYHVKCFFNACTVSSTSEIGNFDSLRWEDQQSVKETCSAGASYDMVTEYAKSNRSTCRQCYQKIDYMELRIGIEYPVEEFDSISTHWYHVDCLKKQMPALKINRIKPDDIRGIKCLKPADKKRLNETFGEAEKTSEAGSGKGKGKKRKGGTDSTDGPAEKKSKEEIAEEKALKVQADKIWKIKDALNNDLNNALMKSMLEANNQSVPTSGSKYVDRCTDGIAFGALQRCPTCTKGQLIFNGAQYVCTGYLTSWTKCTHSTREPDRVKWVIPDVVKEASSFFKTFKPQVKQRVYAQKEVSKDATDSGLVASSSASVDMDTSTSVCMPSQPLDGFTVVIVGKLSKTTAVLTKTIGGLGGSVVKDVDSSTNLCISSKAEVDKMSKKMKEVQKNNVCVVSEDYLDDVQKGGGLVKIMAHKISSWGDIKLGKSGQQQQPQQQTTVAKPTFGADPFRKIKKMAVKGGAVVDPDSGLDRTHHVYESGGVIYNAVLGLVDVVQGTNSFYKLQVLEADASKRYVLFRAWGRVGTSIGGNKKEDHGGSAKKAIAQFESLYAEKTGNVWGTPSDEFVKHPTKFYPLEIDYGQDEEDFAQLMVSAGSNSKLDPAIQSLVKMIFDVDSMKQTLLEFEIDVNKMPLGKLSKKQIESAYKVLTEALKEIQGDKNPTKLLDASNRFYTLIPHNFGMQSPPLLDSEEIIKTKTQMLDNLLEIELTYSLLKQQIKSDAVEQKDPLDINYEKLKTDFSVLSKDSDEFETIKEYVANTHAPTHSSYTLELMDVFKIERHGESSRFKDFKKIPNRKLLWHGSRNTNFAGILSQGLRIAPPEAPVTGYMFGKGVYFADMVSKSANYCFTSRDNPIGLLLLCEVALGEMYELKHSEYVVKPPGTKLSTKALIRRQFDTLTTL